MSKIRKGSLVVCWDVAIGNILAKVLEIKKDLYIVQFGKMTLEYAAESVTKYDKKIHNRANGY